MENPMDNMTDKEKEEAMGISKSQRMALEAAGLTKKEIDELHAKRVEEGIAKERERLDKIEKKVSKGKTKPLPEYLAKMLSSIDNGEESAIREECEGSSFPNIDESKLPWYGRKDLIMSNKEYWEEIDRVVPPSKEEEEEDDWEEMTEEELERAMNRYYNRINSKPTEEVFERRKLGAWKAEYEWYKGGCKGEYPENISEILLGSTNPFKFGKSNNDE